jgi:hypothetical protein
MSNLLSGKTSAGNWSGQVDFGKGIDSKRAKLRVCPVICAFAHAISFNRAWC